MIPLPAPLLNWIANRYLPDNWSLQWQSIEGDLTGAVAIQGLRIYAHDLATDPIARIDRLTMDLALDEAFRPNARRNRWLWLSEATVYLPPQWSPTGLHDDVLKIQELTLNEPGHNLFDLSARVSCGTSRIIIQASGSRPAKSTQRAPIHPAALLKSPQFAQLRTLLNTQPWDLRLQLTRGSNTWAANLTASNRAIALQGIQAQDILVFGNWHSQSPTPLRPTDLSAQATLHFDFDTEPVPERLQPLIPQLDHITTRLTLHNHLLRLQAFSQHAISSDSTATAAPTVDFLTAAVSLNGAADAIRLRAQTEGLTLRAAVADLPQPESILPAAATLKPGSSSSNTDSTFWQPAVQLDLLILDSFLPPWLALLPDHFILTDTTAKFIRIHANIASGWQVAHGIAFGKGVTIGNTLFEQVMAPFTLTPRRLDLFHGHVQKNATEYATGSYFHEFASMRFGMRLRGSLLPSSLDGFLEDWWDKIFRDIDVTQPVPADVAVWGEWRQARAIASLTALTARDVTYAGCPIPLLSLRIRNNQSWTLLEQVRGNFDHGKIEGTMSFRRAKPTDWLLVNIDFRSSADWSIVRQVARLDGLDFIAFDPSPDIQTRGQLWFAPEETAKADIDERSPAPDTPNSERALVPDLQFAISHKGRLFLRDVPLDKISARGTVRDGHLRITPLHGQLHGGILNARFESDDWRQFQQSRRRLTLTLADARLADTVSSLRRTQAVSSTEISGNLFVHGDLTWDSGQSQPTGEGNLQIINADLGGVHLLGGLSRALDQAGLGLTSFSLNSASLLWRTQAGWIEVDDAIVRGPVLVLQLNGGYHFVDDRLDLSVDATLFGGFLGWLISPISRNMSFAVSGNASNPQWNVRVQPLRWLQEPVIPATRTEPFLPASPFDGN